MGPGVQRVADAFRAVDRSATHRRWTTSALVGAVPGLLLQAWMLSAGSWNLFRWGRQADFYDVQARALLHRTLAMDQRVLGIESFARGEQHFMYFGPVPALLRLPVVAVTRHLDGRMAAVSMLVSLVVTVLALLSLGWRLRRRVMDGTEVSTRESVAVASTFFCLVGGSSLLYASSRTWVYHEAILWGVAFTLASLAALLVWLDRRTGRALLWASGFALLAILTRPSVGGGALAALGLVVAGELLGTMRRRDRPADDPDGRPSGAVLVSLVVAPVLVYSAVNWLKFRRLLGVPFDQQGYTLLSPERQAMLEANGGTLFNPKFVPTNLVSYLRPDLVDPDVRLPFLQPTRPGFTIGSPVYDLIDLTSGVTTTMPLLVVLGLVGVWAVVRGSRAHLRDVWPILVGCALGTGAVLVIGYLANRYQSDFLPLLAVAALIGLPVVVDRSREPRGNGSAPLHAIVPVGAAALTAIGLFVNLSFGFSYQRAYSPSTHPDVIAAYVDLQHRFDGAVGDGRLPGVTQGATLPDGSSVGDLAIIGECEGLYLSDGGTSPDGAPTMWRLVERAADNGVVRGRFTSDARAVGASPLVEVTTGGSVVTVAVEIDEAEGVMTVVAGDGRTAVRGPDLPLRLDASMPWVVFADPVLGRLEVFLDGRYAVFVDVPRSGDRPDIVLGRNAVVEETATTGGVCDRLLADLAGATAVTEPVGGSVPGGEVQG